MAMLVPVRGWAALAAELLAMLHRSALEFLYEKEHYAQVRPPGRALCLIISVSRSQ